jgi:hypothetical protein
MSSEQKLAVRMQARVGYKVAWKKGNPMDYAVSEPKRSTPIVAWMLLYQPDAVQAKLQVDDRVWWFGQFIMRRAAEDADVLGVGRGSRYRSPDGYYSLKVEFDYGK